MTADAAPYVETDLATMCRGVEARTFAENEAQEAGATHHFGRDSEWNWLAGN